MLSKENVVAGYILLNLADLQLGENMPKSTFYVENNNLATRTIYFFRYEFKTSYFSLIAYTSIFLLQKIKSNP